MYISFVASPLMKYAFCLLERINDIFIPKILNFCFYMPLSMYFALFVANNV